MFRRRGRRRLLPLFSFFRIFPSRDEQVSEVLIDA